MEDKTITLRQLALVVWILDILRRSPSNGLTFAQIDALWRERSPQGEPLTRPRFDRHRAYAHQLFGVHVECPDRRHYRILNPEALRLDTLSNDLLASVHEYQLIDEFRDLGPRLQPAIIHQGRQYLTLIAQAIRQRHKLAIRYQKFTDSEPYDATIHPYILKAVGGRWYLLAYKENSTHPAALAQMFALDRTLSLQTLAQHFEFNPQVDPATYFDDFYGAYTDAEAYPVRDVTIACHPRVAPYLRTLPIHRSQAELSEEALTPGQQEASRALPFAAAVYFRFHLSDSPDFRGALMRWGPSIVVLEP